MEAMNLKIIPLPNLVHLVVVIIRIQGEWQRRPVGASKLEKAALESLQGLLPSQVREMTSAVDNFDAS